MEEDKKKEKLVCSICGKEIQDGEPHIKGVDGGAICNNCLAQVSQMWIQANGLTIMDPRQNPYKDIKTKERNLPESFDEIPKPKQIKEYLDQYVIGQDDAKEQIAVGVYNHYKRIFNKDKTDEVEIEKSNILLLGPSGSGKSFIARSIAKMLDVPFTIADSTTMSAAGYVGDDVETIITRLLMECDYDVKKAQKGIVFLDEIDKIARKGDSPSISRDVSGEGVQQGLLKLIEGSMIFCPPDPGRKHPEKPVIPVDTTDILFICAEAFEGIEKKIANRMNAHAVGFEATSRRQENGNSDENFLKYVTAEDVRSFGLIPEIVGRLPIITHTNKLSEEDLVKILTEPKNALVKQYQKLMEIDGIEVEFTEEALKKIASRAIKNKTGARGLRSVMEMVMKEIMFSVSVEKESDKKKVTIDLAYVEDHLKDK